MVPIIYTHLKQICIQTNAAEKLQYNLNMEKLKTLEKNLAQALVFFNLFYKDGNWGKLLLN